MTKVGSKKVTISASAPIGPANVAELRPVKVRPARGRCTSAMDAVTCTVAGSTGPKTEDGLAQLKAARTTHGKYTKEKRAEAKRRAELGRHMRAELAELEAWFLDHGQLDKKWRDWFK